MSTETELKEFAQIEHERAESLAKADKLIEAARNDQEKQQAEAQREAVQESYAKLLAKQREKVIAAKAEELKAQSERAKAEAAQAEARKADARRAFLAAGGLESDFESAWPGILANLTIQKMATPTPRYPRTAF